MRAVECVPARPHRGFTLVELLVAVAISVVLVTILAYVFQVATGAVRDANARVALTERLRAMNIRMRKEIGGMLPVARENQVSSWQAYTCYLNTVRPDATLAQRKQNTYLVFASSTVENGAQVSVDVAYVYLPSANALKPELGSLVRLRDGNTAKLGDDKWIVGDAGQGTTLANVLSGASRVYDCDVMLSNVRQAYFELVDQPITMNGLDDDPDGTAGPLVRDNRADDAGEAAAQLIPRTLPAAVKLTITFGPEIGNINKVETAVLVFPVYRGL